MNLGQKNTKKEWFKKGYACFMFVLVALGFQQGYVSSIRFTSGAIKVYVLSSVGNLIPYDFLTGTSK